MHFSIVKNKYLLFIIISKPYYVFEVGAAPIDEQNFIIKYYFIVFINV
jgi:hypothetical protein